MSSNILHISSQFDAFGLSICGPRPNQEDAAVLKDNRYAVLDGLGGHRGGEVASAAGSAGFALGSSFQEALRNCQSSILEAQKRHSGAMTTLVAVEILKDRILYAWAGDSRFYIYRAGLSKIYQVTQDHAMEDGKLYCCLGAGYDIPDSGEISRRPKDILLLCSDGLYNAVPSETMQTSITQYQEQSAKTIATHLLALALRQPQDNTTVLVVKTP